MRAIAARVSDRKVLIAKCLVEHFSARTILAVAASSMLLTVSVLAAPPAAPPAAPSAAKPPAAKPAATPKLAPADIQSTFFDGKPSATTPSSLKFKMTFTADGKMKRQPMVPATAAKAPGSSRRRASAPPGRAARIAASPWPAGDNKWSVLKGSTIMATWSK